jgi:imidazolonepropionase
VPLSPLTNGRIVFIGFESLLPHEVTLTPARRSSTRAAAPWCRGSSTRTPHVIFAGDRRGELRRRLTGASYEEIAGEGGGILSTVLATRNASESVLAADTARRLAEMLRCGTTTAEAKSGYGLTTESELKMLRVIRELGKTQPVELSPTFMGAHEVPVEYRTRRHAYVDLIVSDMIPAVAQERLAEWCDVFCEKGVFTPDESRRS